jgi:hypothetical protein
MTFNRLYENSTRSETSWLFERFPTRDNLLGNIERKGSYDLIISNGGILGIALAQISSFHGLSVLYLASEDYYEPQSIDERYYPLINSKKDFFNNCRSLIKAARTDVVSKNIYLANNTKDISCYFRKINYSQKKLLELAYLIEDLTIPWIYKIFSYKCSDHQKICNITTNPINNNFSVKLPSYNWRRHLLDYVASAIMEGATCVNHIQSTVLFSDATSIRLVANDVISGRKMNISSGMYIDFTNVEVKNCQRWRVCKKPTNQTIVVEQHSGIILSIFPETESYIVRLEGDIDKIDTDSLIDQALLDLGVIEPKKRVIINESSKISPECIMTLRGKILTISRRGALFAQHDSAEILLEIFKIADLKRTVTSLEGRPLATSITLDQNDHLFNTLKSNLVPENLCQKIISYHGNLLSKIIGIPQLLRICHNELLLGEFFIAKNMLGAVNHDEIVDRLGRIVSDYSLEEAELFNTNYSLIT